MESQITLYNFLIKTTNIPKNVIKNHLVFYDMCETEPFGINLDNVIKYLDINNRKKYIERLKLNFIENIDYLKKENKNKFSTKNHLEVYYYITLDTFEKLCMISRTKTGESVRNYFIIIRKFINYYKNNIYNMIIRSDCVMYIILVNKGKNIYKIGKTCDLRKRLATYNTGKDVHPDVKFIIQINKPNLVESCSKALLQENVYQKGKELFKVNIDSIKTAIFNCATTTQQISELNLKNLDSYILFAENDKNKKLSKKIISKTNNKKLSKKIISKTNNKKLSKKIISKTNNKKLSKIIISKANNKKLSKK